MYPLLHSLAVVAVGDASPLRNNATVRSGNPRTREDKAKRMEVCDQPAVETRARAHNGSWVGSALAESSRAKRAAASAAVTCPASTERALLPLCACVGLKAIKRAKVSFFAGCRSSEVAGARQRAAREVRGTTGYWLHWRTTGPGRGGEREGLGEGRAEVQSSA
jgi:hypothetical protein